VCWGLDVFTAAKELGTPEQVMKMVVKPMKKNGTLQQAFDVISKGRPTYSNIGHTREEVR
jgi:hypothetical protein